MLDRRDQEFRVTLHPTHSYDEREYEVVVSSPSGEIAVRLVEAYPRGDRTITVTVPKDGETGVYRLGCAASGSYGSVNSPIEVEPRLPVAFPLARRIIKPGGTQFCLFVPEGTTKVGARLKPVVAGTVCAQITGPGGKRRAHVSERSEGAPVTGCEMTPLDGETGACWELNLGGGPVVLDLISEGAVVPQLVFQGAYQADVCRELAAALR